MYRSKWLKPKAKSLEGMISSLDELLTNLKEMQKSGVYLHKSSDLKSDWLCLATTDSDVADHFGFQTCEEGEEVLEDVS